MADLAVELGLDASMAPYTDDALGRLKVGNPHLVLHASYFRENSYQIHFVPGIKQNVRQACDSWYYMAR